MFKLSGVGELLNKAPSLIGWPSTSLRFASKKASGGKRNPKQSPGNFRGIKKRDGTYVFPGDILVYKQGPTNMWFHPGLNVCMTSWHMNLVALKEGVVRTSVEKPDLNYNKEYVRRFYLGREGHIFFKKYFNVIPNPQHTMFKCVDQI